MPSPESAPAPPARTGRSRWLLRLLVSAALLGGILYAYGPATILRLFASCPPLGLLAVAVALAANLFLNALAFLVLPWQRGPSLGRWLHLTAMAWAWGQFSPGRLGEFSMAAYLQREGQPLGEALAAVTAQRILILLAVFVFAFGGLLHLGGAVGGMPAATLACAVAGGLFGLLLFRLRAPILRRLPARWAVTLRAAVLHLVHLAKRHPGRLAAAGALHLIRLLLLFASSWVVFRLLGAEVAYPTVIAVNAVGRLAAFVPISFNGLGVREGAQVALFAAFAGVDGETVAAVALVIHLVSYGLSGVALLCGPRHRETAS
ncbi:MAG: lysylphosphatidylglycerol synthase transmembrane domain-containing protein [Planctomycetota bacterium]